METFGGSEDLKASGQRRRDDAVQGANNVAGTANGEVKNLIADVEDLVARVANLKDGDVARIRAKVQRAIESTKESIADGADTVRRQAQRAAETADDYVHDNPWQAVGLAALVGALVGILASRRS